MQQQAFEALRVCSHPNKWGLVLVLLARQVWVRSVQIIKGAISGAGSLILKPLRST
jgi:hypothetical protein